MLNFADICVPFRSILDSLLFLAQKRIFPFVRKFHILLILCAFSLLFLVFVGHEQVFEVYKNLPNPLSTQKSPPIILHWTPFFYNKPITLLFRHFSTCKFECTYTDDRELTDQAQVILFHARTTNLTDLPPNRPDQLRVFFNTEGPDQTWFLNRDLPPHDYFNLTITYRSRSDIFHPYNYFQLLNGTETAQERWTEKEIDDAISQKSLLAFSAISHCETWSRRESYLNEMRYFINITSLGRCTSNQECHWEECLQSVAYQHYFFIAFENAVCPEYVTEKFFRLYELTVPIVLTRAIMPKTIPSDSYIAASDFESAEKLCAYLQEVASNRTEYKRFFAWTRRYKKLPFEFWRPDTKCRLCELLHQRGNEQFTADIRPFMDKSICSRDFASILNKRNRKWIEAEEKRMREIMEKESVDRID